MRRLTDILEEKVPLGEYWWGDLFWIEGGPLGYEVRRFKRTEDLEAYASLEEEAFVWAHRDPFAWLVLVIEPAHEVGSDFVMIRRYPGIPIAHFDPAKTDDPVEPPAQLGVLRETVARLRSEAASPSDRFLAELVAKRVAALDHRLVYDGNSGEQRFHLYDLDPTQDELATWIAVR
ncbi:MAG: hypothetical protein KF773_21015 [Deltaproteobacteria bacterium]|nr:hypothetical protein [Deltaproteobacteria bacterium]